MRVIALGGAGAMTQIAVKDLAGKKGVKELVIADYNIGAAEALARGLGDKCSAKQIDANNHAELVDAIRGFDVALGGIGPFYKYEVKIAKACLEARTPYVSLCDDSDAAAEVLKLDRDVAEAGLAMITGCGWTPGVTSVLARKGAQGFDEIDEIAVAWGCHVGDTEGKAVTLHTTHIFTGNVPSYQRGRELMIPAGSDPKCVRFPEPVGEITTYHVGHPEPVTIPRYIRANTVTLRGGLVEGWLCQLARIAAKIRLTTTDRRNDVFGVIYNAVAPPVERFLDAFSHKETCSACRVDLKGRAGNKSRNIIYGAAAHMNLLTGLPLSVAAQMLLENKISQKGVMGPEACIDPDEFLRRLASGGISFYEGDAMTERLAV